MLVENMCTMYRFLTQKTTFLLQTLLSFYMTGVHAWGEEGEEKHPPVGKEINRPQYPNKTPLPSGF